MDVGEGLGLRLGAFSIWGRGTVELAFGTGWEYWPYWSVGDVAYGEFTDFGPGVRLRMQGRFLD